MTCENCFHADEQRMAGQITTVIVCTRYPPQVILAGNRMMAVFPIIQADLRCGEYKADVARRVRAWIETLFDALTRFL